VDAVGPRSRVSRRSGGVDVCPSIKPERGHRCLRNQPFGHCSRRFGRCRGVIDRPSLTMRGRYSWPRCSSRSRFLLNRG